MHELDCTPCILKQNVEPPILHVFPPILALKLTIGSMSQFFIMFSCNFRHGINHVYMPIWTYPYKMLSFPMIFFGLLKNPILFMSTQIITQAIAKHPPSCMNYICPLFSYWSNLHIMPKTWFS